jgi:uncharacterized membrane protein YeaQ/YmgE (transglycosylase-associated protein family)
MVGAAVGAHLLGPIRDERGYITSLNIWSIVLSVIGAIIVLWVYKALVART